MYKHVALLVRQEGMSHEEFREYWEENHSPLAKDIEGVVRYQTVYPTDPENAEFDGLAELYFETIDDLHEALGSEGSRDYDPTREVAAEAREDVDNFLDVERRPRFIGRERVWKNEVNADSVKQSSTSDRTSSGDTNGLYKHSAFLVRREGMSHEEFRESIELGVLGIGGVDGLIADDALDVLRERGVVFLPVLAELLVAHPLLADEQRDVLVHARSGVRRLV